MNSYPADERRISEVERGLCCNATLALPDGQSPSAGDAILFALAAPISALEPNFIKGGDSVRVLLTDVTDLEETDLATGQSLYRLSWEPLGKWAPAPSLSRSRKIKVS